MAVYLIIWGRNPHDLNDEKVIDELKERIKKVELNFDFFKYQFYIRPTHDEVYNPDKDIRESIRDYVQDKQKDCLPRKDRDIEYNPENWKIEESKENWIAFTYTINTETNWSFTISFSKSNNLAEFHGGFSHWNDLAIHAHEIYRKGWQQLIGNLFKYFDVKQVFYFSEWGFNYEDCENFDELTDFIQQNPDCVVSRFEDLWNYNDIYIENL